MRRVRWRLLGPDAPRGAQQPAHRCRGHVPPLLTARGGTHKRKARQPPGRDRQVVRPTDTSAVFHRARGLLGGRTPVMVVRSNAAGTGFSRWAMNPHAAAKAGVRSLL